MSVVVCVKVLEGIVLAADSAITVLTNSSEQKPEAANVYLTAEKVFSLGESLPVGVATLGGTSIGSRLISNLVKDFALRISGDACFMNLANYTIEGIAKALKQFIFDECCAMSKDKDDWRSVFIIGGYSTNASLPEAWQLVIGGDQQYDLDEIGPGQQFGVFHVSRVDTIRRLIYGYGDKLQQVLAGVGIEGKQLKAIMDKCRAELKVETAPGMMPINDAARLAFFLVETAKWFDRFKVGLQTIDGPTDVAMITKDEGVCWLRRKDPFNILNCM